MRRNRNLFEDREYQMRIIENNELELEKLDIKCYRIEDRQISTEVRYGKGIMSDRVYNKVSDEIIKELEEIKREKEKVNSKLSKIESGLEWEDLSLIHI